MGGTQSEIINLENKMKKLEKEIIIFKIETVDQLEDEIKSLNNKLEEKENETQKLINELKRTTESQQQIAKFNMERICRLESQIRDLNIKKMSKKDIENTFFDHLTLGTINDTNTDKIVLSCSDVNLVISPEKC